MIGVKIEHFLLFAVAIFLLYHLMVNGVNYGCGIGGDGFSVGIDTCGDQKKMGIWVTTPLTKTCETEIFTCADDDTLLLDWSQTSAPACKSGQCSGDDTPLSKFYNKATPITDYDGSWSYTGQNDSSKFIKKSKIGEIDAVCTSNSGAPWGSPQRKELSSCWLGKGTRALCGYKVNSASKCEGVTSGIPDYCKKNEYCCNKLCCEEPCNTKGTNICRE